MTTESTSIPTVNGTRHEGGAGPPIVLLHSLAMDRSLWDDHIAPLQELGDVIAVDLPGHGGSAPVSSTSIEEMADAVAAYLASVDVDRAVVCGLSLGGCVAQALAVRQPSAVAALTLVDTTPWYGTDAPERWAERGQKAAMEGFESLANFQLARWFSPGFVERHPELSERLLDIFRKNDVTSYQSACHAMGAMDLREAVTAIDVPTIVQVGELDPATPVAMAQDLAGRIDNAELRVLESCSHLSPVENPDAFVTAVKDVSARVR